MCGYNSAMSDSKKYPAQAAFEKRQTKKGIIRISVACHITQASAVRRYAKNRRRPVTPI